MSRQSVMNEINTERECTKVMWTDEGDDRHTCNDWIALLSRHAGLAVNDGNQVDDSRFRKQIIRVAALALSAVEAYDRKHGAKDTLSYPEGSGY